MEILKKPIVKDVITSVIYLLLVIIYFIVFNTQVNLLGETLTTYINISSMTFLVIAIIMFEVGYRKDKSKIFINGIEFFILAIFTLLIKHIPKVSGYTFQDYTEIVTYTFVAYYIAKTGIMYTKMRHNQLKDMSDIKDIVKEEPTKKATKRKNKREEGK